MALASGTVFAIQASATTGNVNGSGFNPASTNFFTNLAATVANTSSPVVTSASYNFVAGDVGNWVYIKSGTHWQAGWYKIASVASNAATLSAAIGAAIISIGASGVVAYNTTAGCTSDNTATLSSGTGGVDYSQTDTATATSSTATSSGAGSLILFAGATVSMPGNFVQVISGTNFTAGWYEITAATAGVSITTDRAVTTGVGAVGVINVGGAGRFNGVEDAYQAMLPAGALVWMKNGSYTISGAISTASSNATNTNPVQWIGFNAARGDVCNGTNRPLIIAGANAVTFSKFNNFINIIGTSTSAGGFAIASGGQVEVQNCKFTNTSSTASRLAANFSNAAGGAILNSEFVSQMGNGLSVPNSPAGVIQGCYLHDSDRGCDDNKFGSWINNIFEANTTYGWGGGGGFNGSSLIGNTFYGREGKIGTGCGNFNQNTNIVGNIFYGLATGIAGSNRIGTNFDYLNNFFNNTTDISGGWVKDMSDTALNPTFAGASQLTNQGTVTTSGSVLTDSGASFGVTDNVDYLHVLSGTGVTVGIYLITSHTSTTLTVNNALGTGSSVTYFVTHGHNFQIGSPVKGVGMPQFTNATGSQTTGYPASGAVQPQASSVATVGYAFA